VTTRALDGAPAAMHVLLDVARGADGPRPLAARAWPDDATWRAVPALARAHRMQGLLHRALAFAERQPPEDVRRAVADDARVVAQQALMRMSALREIGDAAAARGIPLMPYKGPVLSLVAYGDVGLRPTADLDVLVPRSHRAAATAMLRDCGYEPASEFGEPLHRRLHAHLGATPWRGTGGLVELHWRLCEVGLPWTIDAAALQSRATMVTCAGRAFATPAADDLLLMLAWHGARHAWEQLEWLAAVAALARAHSPDWAALAERAAAYGGARAVLLAQSLLAEWLGVAEPPRAAEWLREAHALVVSQYEQSTTLFTGDRARYRHFLRVLLERPADRGALACAQLFLPTAVEGRWLPLPAALWPLYVPLRLVRLSLRAAGLGGTSKAARS